MWSGPAFTPTHYIAKILIQLAYPWQTPSSCCWLTTLSSKSLHKYINRFIIKKHLNISKVKLEIILFFLKIFVCIFVPLQSTSYLAGGELERQLGANDEADAVAIERVDERDEAARRQFQLRVAARRGSSACGTPGSAAGSLPLIKATRPPDYPVLIYHSAKRTRHQGIDGRETL